SDRARTAGAGLPRLRDAGKPSPSRKTGGSPRGVIIQKGKVRLTVRILHVYRTYFPDTQGGLEETIRQTCLSTARLGAESRVLSLSGNPSPRMTEREEAVVFRARRSFEIAS